MNMISTGAFLNEMDASNKQPTVAEKFAAVWEKKNAKAARAGGVSLMALSLAACGSSSTTTTSSTSTTTTTTTATDAAKSLVFTKDVIDQLEGGSGNDTFTGDANTSAADSANGGAGTDTVKLVGSTTLPEMTSVETLHLKSFTPAAVNVSTTALADIETLTLDSFTVNTMTVTLGAGQLVNIDDATGAAATISIAGDKWTSGTVDLSHSGDGTNAVDLDFTSAKTTSVTIKESGSTAESFVKVLNTGAKAATVNIDSSYKLTVEDVAVATTINAGTSTGAVTLSTAVDKIVYTGSTGVDKLTLAHADGGSDANEFTVKTGAGDDVVTITNMDSATADFTDSKNTIDGGAGDDTLVGVATLHATAGAATAAAWAKKGITGFEKIQFSDALDNDGVYNMTNYGANHVILTTDDVNNAIISGLTTGATIELATTIKAVGSTTGGTDDVAFTLSDRAGSGDQINFVVKNTANTGLFSVDVQEVEIISIDASASTKANSFELDTPHATKLILDTGKENLTVDLTLNNVAGLNISEVDASGATSTGGIIFKADGSNLSGITIKGGSGGDTLVGGDLSDTITAGSGADSIDAGAGTANTVDISSGGDDDVVISNRDGAVTITGFASGDDLDLADDEFDGAESVISVQQAAQVNPTNDSTIIVSLNAASHSILSAGSETIADFTDLVDVAAYLEEAFAPVNAEDFAFILNDGTNSYAYHVDVDGGAGAANTILSDDVFLMATIEGYVITATTDILTT